MFTSPLPVFSLLLLFSTTTTGQPYIPTDYYLLNCGGETATSDHRKWDTDEQYSNNATTSFTSIPNDLDPSIPEIPYSSARIFNTSSFTYTFPMITNGPKLLRLYFYPVSYSTYNANQFLFSVSSNGDSLLSNFSPFVTATYLGTIVSRSIPLVPYVIKEFIIYVKDTQSLKLTFTLSPYSYAFINGIEIVSLPETLYFKRKDMILESIYRLNVGGGYISGNDDTGMYRSWDTHDNYLFPRTATGVTPVYKNRIMYTMETPNYTAPELVYQTQRSMGNLSMLYNLTWIFPVDSGFYYMLRLHFCSITTPYALPGEIVFTIFINNQTVEEWADLFSWTPGSGYPVFKDYIVLVSNPDGLWLAMHPNSDASSQYGDAFLNGLEVIKISMPGSVSSINPELILTPPPPSWSASPAKENTKRTTLYAAIIGGVGGGLVLFSALGFIIFWQRQVSNKSSGEPKYIKPALPSTGCRRFSLEEVKEATSEFNDDCVIGKGGFGKVYKGCIDNDTVVVAIKRLNSSSNQGSHEFQTEIGMLSKLQHENLVSLIGYCDDEGEMLLVYDYMAQGTLREHLYNTNNPHLSWKTRLHICIGAAKGIQYLHTGTNRVIIHRDVKSTNILLDENWVAKVSDFGLSKLGPEDQRESHVSTMVKGTFGYMDPEYYRMQKLTNKSDVYSFGVVLLEVLCARPVIDINLPYEEVSLGEWAKSHYRKGTLHEIIDPKLSGEIAPKCLMKFGEVANDSLKEKGSKRPSMDDVVWGLEFALQLQEDVEQTGDVVGEFVLEKQELLFPILGGSTSTGRLTGSVMQHSMSSTDNSHGGIDSETVLPR